MSLGKIPKVLNTLQYLMLVTLPINLSQETSFSFFFQYALITQIDILTSDFEYGNRGTKKQRQERMWTPLPRLSRRSLTSLLTQ